MTRGASRHHTEAEKIPVEPDPARTGEGTSHRLHRVTVVTVRTLCSSRMVLSCLPELSAGFFRHGATALTPTVLAVVVHPLAGKE